LNLSASVDRASSPDNPLKLLKAGYSLAVIAGMKNPIFPIIPFSSGGKIVPFFSAPVIAVLVWASQTVRLRKD
jgi:hypothetical protein